MKISTKLISAFVATSGLCALVGGLGYWGMVQLAHHVESIGKQRLPSVQALLNLRNEALSIVVANRTLAMPDASAELRRRMYEKLDQASLAAAAAWKSYENLPHSDAQTQAWDAFDAAWRQWKTECDKYRQLCVAYDGMGIGNPAALAQEVEKFTKDHHVAVANVLHLLHEGTTFKGGEDHTACNAGRWLSAFASSSPELTQAAQGIVEPHTRFHAAIKQIKTLAAQGKTNEAQQAYVRELKPSMEQVFTQFDAIKQQIEHANSAYHAAETQLNGPVIVTNAPVMDLLDQLVELNDQECTAEVEQATATAHTLEMITVGSVVVGALVSIILGLLISGSIRKALHAMVARLQDIAQGEGDLTQRVDESRRDELGELGKWFNTFVKKIHDTIASAKMTSADVASASEQIAEGSRQLAEGANQQASALEEVSASLEEMSSMTQQNAANSDQANQLAKAANTAATSGDHAMKRMADAINRIKSSSDETANIVKTIDEIAFQTNLLALNAAVEAARAGDAGKGFAVVAEEVRALAQRSAEAAKSTAHLIAQAVKNADDGVSLTEEVQKLLGEIVTGSGRVNDLVSEIAAASKEQADGIKQVNDAMASIDKVTQTTAANSEESSAAAAQLQDQVSTLNTLVGSFKVALHKAA